MDWDAYWTKLEDNITELATALSSPINTLEKLEQATNELFDAINNTTREVAPPIKIMLHTKQWWTNELSSLHIDRNRASAEHY